MAIRNDARNGRDEWDEDLNPSRDFGLRRAADIKDLYSRFHPEFNRAELERIPVLPPGSRLRQGSAYLRVTSEAVHEFTATTAVEVREDEWIIPKDALDYGLANRLLGHDSPPGSPRAKGPARKGRPREARESRPPHLTPIRTVWGRAEPEPPCLTSST